jgi:hypothetical protein
VERGGGATLGNLGDLERGNQGPFTEFSKSYLVSFIWSMGRNLATGIS